MVPGGKTGLVFWGDLEVFSRDGSIKDLGLNVVRVSQSCKPFCWCRGMYKYGKFSLCAAEKHMRLHVCLAHGGSLCNLEDFPSQHPRSLICAEPLLNRFLFHSVVRSSPNSLKPSTSTDSSGIELQI